MIDNLQKRTASAMAFTEEVTTRWNDRLTGSKACLACGDYLLENLATFCDTTRMHPFKVRPGGFLGYMKIVVVLYFLALLALWTKLIVVAVVLSTLLIVISVMEFFYYKEFVDFLFPEKDGKNVVGFIEPKGEVKQQIIVSAHHDSAHIFNFLAEDPESFVKKILIASLATYCIPIAAWLLWLGQALGFSMDLPIYFVAGIFTLLGYWVGKIWFFYDEKGTPGAGDNMVCTALAMEIGKYFAQQKKAGKGLEHTRVLIASWDAEEAGLRGARAYVKQYRSDLKAIPTYNFNLECMYNHKELSFLTSDLNSFVPLSTTMAEECKLIGKELGYTVGITPFPFLGGGTDAAEFAKAGIEATTLAAMSWTDRSDKPAYHTLRDTIDAVDAVAVSRSIEMGIHYILKKEQNLSL